MTLLHLLDDAKCFEVTRAHRWPEGVRCPHRHADQIIKQGRDVVNTDEYSIYARLSAWDYVHVTVNHSEGEYACDADGDGVNEVHVNTTESLWSLLRSWLRPHRGISQRFLPLCIGFFQAMHNIRQCGHSLLCPLLSLLLTSAH